MPRAPSRTPAPRASFTALTLAVVALPCTAMGMQTRVPRAPRSSAPGAAALVERLVRTGSYERALTEGARSARRPDVAVRLAGAEMALGRYEDAARRLSAQDATNPAIRGARLDLADVSGDRVERTRLVEAAWADWAAGRTDRHDADALLAVATAMRLSDRWRDANQALREASRVAPRRADVEIAWGRLLLAKYNVGDARTAFERALDLDPGHPDALVGLARCALEESRDVETTEASLAAALATNPRHAEALALRGRLRLDAEDLGGVLAIVDDLRRTNPRDLGAAWLAGARAQWLGDEPAWARERQAIVDRGAGDGRFFAPIAEALVRQRRYAEAIRVGVDCLALAQDDPACLASLGMTRLRLGEETEGMALLRRAWQRDPFDQRTLNLLDLFEKVIPARYEWTTSPHFRVRHEPKARAAITQTVVPFLESTWTAYVKRYGFEPRFPVAIELYGDPAHFAVRTSGLPSLGVTAVCFGPVITAHAPTNATFNWGMVFAHELAHVFALDLSGHRVPRWFTEGLSELEAMRMNPAWRRHENGLLFAALADGTLPPLAHLSSGFTDARSSRQAALAYAHAAAALDHFDRRFGFPALREALAAWRRRKPDEQVLEKLAGRPLPVLDAELREDLRGRAAASATPDAHVVDALLKAALGRVTVKDLPAAEALLRRATAIDPERVDSWALLSKVLGDMGGSESARLDVMEHALALDPHDAGLAKRMLFAHARLGHTAKVIALAQAARFVDPGDPDVEAADARALAASGRAGEAIAAYDRALALGHPSPAPLRAARDALAVKLGQTPARPTPSVAPAPRP